MNRTKILFISVIIFVFCMIGISYSQVKITGYSGKFRPPIVTIELLFSYSQPLPNMFGDIKEFFWFENYGVKSGLIGTQLNFKLSADKKGKIRPYLCLGYALFRGKDNGTAYIDSNIIENGYPPQGSLLYTNTPGSSKIFLHIFNAGLGFEYAFVNKTRWTPHLETDLDVNMIFGTYKQTPNNSNKEVSFTIKQATRFGFAFGGGVQVRLSKAFGLGMTAKYKFANLLGKSSQRTYDQNKMMLLDKKATDINTYLNKSRNIQYLEIMLGAVFYIGKK